MELDLKYLVAPNVPAKEDIFKDAKYIYYKGYTNQTKDKKLTIAIDYYLSGVKIDPSHYGCAYNAAYCYYTVKQFVNAEKWFGLASKLHHDTAHDSLIGQALSCLRIG